MDELWEQLQKFTVSAPSDELGFVDRLAQDNAWRSRYARRVYDEYLKFVYLMATSDASLTPSDAVDQAWHLHLCYSESYWNDLCGGLIKQALHHGPTKGGSAEATRYSEQYQATLDAYRQRFGEPPEDIWPPVEERFNLNNRFRRINLRGKLVIRMWQLVIVFCLTLGVVAMDFAAFIDGLFDQSAAHFFVVVFLLMLFLTILFLTDRHASGRSCSGGGGCGTDGCGGGCGGCGD